MDTYPRKVNVERAANRQPGYHAGTRRADIFRVGQDATKQFQEINESFENILLHKNLCFCICAKILVSSA